MATTYDNLLESIITDLESESSIEEVIVGTYGAVALEHKVSTEFPCVEIVGTGYGGIEYIDQTNIRTQFNFRINAHAYTSTTDRIDGGDMITLEQIAATIKTVLFSFIDADTAPCSGYRLTNSEFNIDLQYQEHTDNINTAQIDISFIVDIADTNN